MFELPVPIHFSPIPKILCGSSLVLFLFAEYYANCVKFFPIQSWIQPLPTLCSPYTSHLLRVCYPVGSWNFVPIERAGREHLSTRLLAPFCWNTVPLLWARKVTSSTHPPPPQPDFSISVYFCHWFYPLSFLSSYFLFPFLMSTFLGFFYNFQHIYRAYF